MKKSILLVVACSVISLNVDAQKDIATTPEAMACVEDLDINPYSPLAPKWFFEPYKIYTGCPQIFVGLGETNPKYLLDAHKGTGRFKTVKTAKVQAGNHLDYGNYTMPYPGTGFISAYVSGEAILLDLGKSYFNGAGSKRFTVSSDGEVKIYSHSNYPLIIYKNDGTKAVQVDNSGKLHARQIEVDVDVWPDYVFKKGYQLMSLEELAEYIIKNKHLPNIPSAVNVGKNGLNLGKMQKLLMEKVEELTIYTIQQNNQIKQLEKENQMLKDELSALRKDVDDIKAMLNK